MDAGPQPSDIIRVLRQHELMLSSLYETFARLLPEMRDFWQTIAKEERAHAEVLELLASRLSSKVVQVDRTKFTYAGIQSAITFLSGRISRYCEEGVTRETALNAAIDAEHGALEKEYFSLFKTKDPEMLAEFEELASHTRAHQKRLEDEKGRLSES